MESKYVRIGETIIRFEDGVKKASIDHQMDEESEYAGCYKITLEDGAVINLEVHYDGGLKRIKGVQN